MERHFYAWLWPYGVATDGDTGAPIGHLHRFASRRARDSWVTEAAHVPRSNPGYREACPATWRKYDADPQVHG